MTPVYRDVPVARDVFHPGFMISVHRDVPGDRDVSTSFKKSVEKFIITCQ